jgi:prophage tail gpP-like protein
MFYHYEVQGAWGEDTKAIVTYGGANTSRKRVIMADKLQDDESCQDRAEYEKNLAIAKGLTVKATVPGIWQELTGQSLNRLILVKSKKETFEEKLLIKSVSVTVNDKAQSTDVELFPPFAEKAND